MFRKYSQQPNQDNRYCTTGIEVVNNSAILTEDDFANGVLGRDSNGKLIVQRSAYSQPTPTRFTVSLKPIDKYTAEVVFVTSDGTVLAKTRAEHLFSAQGNYLGTPIDFGVSDL